MDKTDSATDSRQDGYGQWSDNLFIEGTLLVKQVIFSAKQPVHPQESERELGELMQRANLVAAPSPQESQDNDS